MKNVWLLGIILLVSCSATEGVTTLPAPTETAVPLPTEPTELPAALPSPTPSVEADPVKQADADVLFVRAVETAAATWTFSVTVAHPDTGWEDYADGWDVLLPDGSILLPKPDDPFTRLLLHPHVDEQPFTRSQSGIQIPASVTAVTVRAHDLLDGFGGQEVVVDLTAVSGPNFEVEMLTP